MQRWIVKIFLTRKRKAYAVYYSHCLWWRLWIVSVVWSTDERRLALFPARNIVRNTHHHKSPTHGEQDLSLCWMKLCSIDKIFEVAGSFLKNVQKWRGGYHSSEIWVIFCVVFAAIELHPDTTFFQLSPNNNLNLKTIGILKNQYHYH